MTTNPIDDRPTLDDVHRMIASLRDAYRTAKRNRDITEMSSIRNQHAIAMRQYRAMQLLRAQGKDPRDYFNS